MRANSLSCYSDAVSNITVSLPDDIYRRVRVRAAEQNTSVSALVRQFLTELGGAETEFERLRRVQDDVLASVSHFTAGDRLTREQVHERKVR